MRDISKKSAIGSNVVAVASCVLLIGASWGNSQARLNELEGEIEQYQNDIEPSIKNIEETLAQLRVEQAQIATDIIWIKDQISE